MKMGGVRFLANVLHQKQNNSQSEIFSNKIKWRILIKVNPRYMQIKLDRRIEESGDRTRIELYQSAMVNTGIRIMNILLYI